MDALNQNAVVGGRYRLEERLESGGMGTIFAARDERSGSKVAVKVINEELARDASLRERFRREAMAAAALNNPHIVRILDFGREEDRRSWIVMEYVEGETLSDAMKREAPIAQRRVVFIAAQILDALAVTHAAGIVHRDLKPPNILLTEIAGVKDAVKLMDFGIAKLMESEAYQRLTKTGQIVGTPAFMAPEQARGDEIDGRADLYALGVVMYAALANRLPYVHENNAELLIAIQESPPIPLTEVAAAVQPELWTEVIEPVLRKDPNDRFATAQEMLAALKPFLRARTGDMQEIRAADLMAAEAQPRPVVPAPAELARTRPKASQSSHPPPAAAPSPVARLPLLALIALMGGVLLMGMAAGVFLTLTFVAGGEDDPQVTTGNPGNLGNPTATPSTTGAAPGLDMEPSPPAPDEGDGDASLTEEWATGTEAGEDSSMRRGRRRRRGDAGVAMADDDRNCQSNVVLAAAQSSGYPRDVARAAARPHVARASRCLHGRHPRQVMITLDVDLRGHIGSATVGGPHTEAEASCIQSIFAHTRLPARPQVPGPLVLTLAAAGCEGDAVRN